MRIIKLAAVCCCAAVFAAAFAACGAQAPNTLPVSRHTPAEVGTSSTAGSASGVCRFGETREWDTGLSITVSAPRSLTPSDTAFPQAPRAAMFEMTLNNRTTEVYKPTLLLVKATAAGKAAQEVIDPAQGLNGIVSGAQDVPPGKTLKLTAAFAVPDRPVTLEMTVLPDSGGRFGAVNYEGLA